MTMPSRWSGSRDGSAETKKLNRKGRKGFAKDAMCVSYCHLLASFAKPLRPLRLNPKCFFMKYLYFFTLTLAFFTGCKSYSPAPIDWGAEWETWQGMGTNQVILSQESVRALALVGNPELSMLRLKCAMSSNAVFQAGWWDDPEISFDGLRVLSDGACVRRLTMSSRRFRAFRR